ncbi:PfkB domain protein [Kribbella flavida DSM 17836]|uniref:Ribokinase n=1 Tax=Kribbella flavida (strain DSM 17836 / JCM 10339 / NBRC 14399) TaxID=479435 RepID=D2PQU7_KRIFD|nr:PfkB family carbohydrate kinase [Kribbella flavida]ADB31080.1 PfkB domain protein [Kribbella flavida DSM 17836]
MTGQAVTSAQVSDAAPVAPAVVVVGSANLDLRLSVEAMPRPGETVLASGIDRGPGGKGANQAAAAARAGVATALVGVVGDDDGGRLVRSALVDAGVDLGLLRTSSTPTGTAIITVDRTGENAITVAPSANDELTMDSAAVRAASSAAVLLVQLEIPLETVRAAAAVGRYVMLNAAPAAELDADLLADVDLLVVNEHEAAVVAAAEAGVVAAAEAGGSASGAPFGTALLEKVPAVVVTLGPAGALLLRRGADPVRVSGVEANAIDTTAAGDTFCGVLAAGLATGTPLPEAVLRANAAASLAVEARGAMPSIPDAASITARLDRLATG